MDENQQQPIEETESLEAPDTTSNVVSAEPVAPENVDTNAAPNVLATPDDPLNGASKPAEEKPKNLIRKIMASVNIYVILLVIIVLLIAGTTYYAVRQNNQSTKDSTLNTQNLSIDELKKLSSSDAQIGDPTQTLNIQSNTIFAGKVLVRDSADIAGSLKVGGTLSTINLNVAGTSTHDLLQSNSLAVSGDAAIQGKLNVQSSLTVNGSAAFSGPVSAPQLTVDTLLLNRDLVLSHHLNTTGGIPASSNGSALGSGGTSSVNGTDTAGTVTINTGGSAPAGCFINITFVKNYANVPHIVISPVGSVSATLNYYANRTATGFSVCTTNDPPDNTSGIVFDYIIVG